MVGGGGGWGGGGGGGRANPMDLLWISHCLAVPIDILHVYTLGRASFKKKKNIPKYMTLKFDRLFESSPTKGGGHIGFCVDPVLVASFLCVIL